MKSASSRSTAVPSVPSSSSLQLACLAPSPAAVRAAIDAGADWVRIPFQLAHACAPLPLNDRASQIIRYVHGRGRKVSLDLCVSAHDSRWKSCRDAVAWAAAQGLDAVILSDIALALHSAMHFPALPVHFVTSPTICARTATQLKLQLNAARILVTPALSVAQLAEISGKANVEIEILASGSTIATNAAAPAPDNLRPEDAGNPCNDPCYSSKRHLAWTLQQLPLMASLGIRAVQVEARSDMPNDVANVARIWRSAIDRCLEDCGRYAVDPARRRRSDLKRTR
jgi:O2-independent ubiquinone biosynthesis protein UbiU